MKWIRRYLARRRLERSLKPCPELRARRLAAMSPERKVRCLRNMNAIQAEIGGAR